MTQYLITACVHSGNNVISTYLTDSVSIRLNEEGECWKTPNWVPGVHDKVPIMIGGAMPLLNPG